MIMGCKYKYNIQILKLKKFTQENAYIGPKKRVEIEPQGLQIFWQHCFWQQFKEKSDQLLPPSDRNTVQTTQYLRF